MELDKKAKKARRKKNKKEKKLLESIKTEKQTFIKKEVIETAKFQFESYAY